jgi:hypothetical protein
MLSKIQVWLALFLGGVLVMGGCAPAWQPTSLEGVALQPGRYLQKYYRSPDLDPVAGGYQVEVFPVEQVRGLGTGQAGVLFNEELVKAMAANGLPVNQEKHQFVLSGAVDRFAVASPTWRFFSGRGHADLRVVGEIRRGQEVVFAFQDEVAINPQVNPRHRPTLEPDLIARQAARRFAMNLLNELLLPPGKESGEGVPAGAPATR